MAWLHLLFALLVNAIPAWGVFTLGWSVGVLLILFWFENLLGVLLSALRLRLHARGKGAASSGRAGEFLSTALPFALAHGVFAILLPFAFAQEAGAARAALWAPRWEDLQVGAALVALTLLLDLAIDLPGLARRASAAVQAQAQARMARVLTLHVVLIFGAIAASKFESPYGMLAVMLGLKTLVDAASTRAGRGHAAAAPPPPAAPSVLQQREAEAERGLTPEQRAARERSRE